MDIAHIIEQIVFYFSAIMVVGASLMVVSSRNPVQGALFLVLAFVASSVLWILLEAEFLGLALIFVYVGAVMTLFLFVVMMLNIKTEPFKKIFVRFLPLGILIAVLILLLLISIVAPRHFGVAHYAIPKHASTNYSNVKELGSVLYTIYMYPFEIAGVLLVLAIIAAISLALPESYNRKVQKPEEQVKVKRDDRIRLIKMKSEVDKKYRPYKE